MKKLLIPVVAAISLYSCSNSDDNLNQEKLTFTDGYFITNEGGFGNNNATVSHLNSNINEFTANVYTTVNAKPLGDVAQSITVSMKYVYVVMNNSNTIEVVDKSTFKSVHTITEQLNFPRYAVEKNGKLYVSLLNNAQVNVYNAETFEYIKSVALDYPADQLVANSQYVYAASNFYSGGNVVEVIDLETDANTVDISLEGAINGLTISNEKVYAMTNNDTSSFIYAINENTVEETKNLELANSRNLSIDGQFLFFTSETDVYKIPYSLTNNPIKLFNVGDGNAYSLLYGFNVYDGYIFTGNAGNFSDNGEISVYNEDGTLIKQYKTGIAPNGFYKY